MNVFSGYSNCWCVGCFPKCHEGTFVREYALAFRTNEPQETGGMLIATIIDVENLNSEIDDELP